MNKYNLSGEKGIYVIDPATSNIVNITGFDNCFAVMMAGEEITLPEQKTEPKFKVGDKVKVDKFDGIHTVIQVESQCSDGTNDTST